MKELREHVKSIANEITKGEYDVSEVDPDYVDDYADCCAEHYIHDALDIQYIVSSKKEYLGSRILVAFGGPNIWINTHQGVVEGYWGGDSEKWGFTDNLGLDEYLEEIYNCI